MSTRSGRIRPSAVDSSPPRTRKGISPPRSPARTRKSSPPAPSPSRKSPARKSPSRKPASKFPARKSPSRTTKEVIDTAQKAPTKRASIKTVPDLDVKLVDFIKSDGYRTTRGRRSEYSIKDFSSFDENEYVTGEKINGVETATNSKDVYGLRNRKAAEDVAPRRSGRLREYTDSSVDIKRSHSKSISKSISQSIDTFSDEDNSEEELRKDKSQSVTRKLATPLRDSVNKLAQFNSRWEFGGRIGSAILILLLPLTVLSILISCTKLCAIKSLANLSIYKSLSLWYSPSALILITVQYIVQAIITCLPILGTKADRMDDSGRKQTFNAFFSSIFTVTLLFTLDFFKILNNDIILKDYVKLAVVSFLIAVILSIILYQKSRNLEDSELNPYGNTGYVLYDFWMGREIHPYLKQLDVKIWISRVCNINALILSILIFKHGIILPSKVPEELSLEAYKDVLVKIQYKPSILLYSMMQIIYILNFVMREHKITSTFYWQSEGVGYLLTVSSALYPFYFTTISKFVADKGLSLSNNTLIASSILFVVGLVIMLISNNIKYEFRKNPLHPSLTHLDSMPTFHGKKLLTSNLWGILRHPNYAGDMLVHLALAVPGVAGGELLAAAPAVITIVALLYRAARDHARCRRRYGAAWQRYCKKVSFVVLPKIL